MTSLICNILSVAPMDAGARDWTAAPSYANIVIVKKLDGQDSLDNSQPLHAIMDAGREIHGAFTALDTVIADRLGVQRNDLRCLHLLKHGPVTAGDIGAGTGLTSGSVTALIDRLEAGGHVARQRSTADRRSVEIAMSECRAREFEAIGEEVEQAIRDVFGDMTADEIAAAGTALGRFARALGQCSARFESRPKCPPAG